MASSLRTQLDALASHFADEILATIKSASLHELAAGGRTSVATSKGVSAGRVPAMASARSEASGRLARRSMEEIVKAVDKIVLLVKTHKEGMRAEDIRKTLGLQPKEMPRILKHGITAKKLSTKGRKRATTYFAK